MTVKTIEVTFRYRQRAWPVASATDFRGYARAVSAGDPPKFRDVGELTRGAFGASLVRLTTTGRRGPRPGRGSGGVVVQWFARVAFAIVAMAALAFAIPACDQPPRLGTPDPAIDAGIESPPPIRDAGTTPDTGVGFVGADAGTDAGSIPADYSIVVLPDTQYYAAAFPDIFMKQTTWIVENRDAQQIKFVLHTGDVVDYGDSSAQWTVASNSLHVLDGIVPYVIAAGNHDYGVMQRMGMVNVYFPPSGFEAYSWFGDTFEPGHIENSFSLIPAGGKRWLVISLEFGPRNEALAWAGSVLQALHDYPAIIITHAYLYRDSSRYDHNGPNYQYFNPHTYFPMEAPQQQHQRRRRDVAEAHPAQQEREDGVLGPRRELR